jgi:transposase-like protein
MARRGYSDEVKAACLAALLAGQAPAEVAAAYSVPINTLRSWKSRLGAADGAPLVSADERGRVGALLLGYLADLIGALRKQTTVFSDLDWLKKQSAGELAVLHGVCVDKGVRLLEALEAGGEQDG